MRFQWVKLKSGLCVRVLLVVQTSILLGSSPAPEIQGFGPRQMPAIGLRASDSIEDLDFAVTGNGAVETAWLVNLRKDPNADRVDTQVWYRHLDLSNGRWGAPTLVTQHAKRPLRVLSLNGQLHILTGSLRHYVSNDGGAHWRELPSVGPTENPIGLITLDAVSDGRTIIICYLARGRRAPTGFSDSVVVNAATWSHDQGLRRVKVASYAAAPSAPEPKLLISGREIRLVFAVNHPRQLSSQSDAAVFYSSSRDAGATWTQPQQISTLGTQDNQSRKEGSGEISHLDAAVLGEQCLVFYNAGWLYAIRSDGGRSWTEPWKLIGATTWLGTAATRSVSAAAVGTTGQLLWIDDRFQRSDRTPMNPWGLPWFLDPDWVNNDVLALPLSRAARANSELTDTSQRLTRDLSYATRVKAKAWSGNIYVLWPGRVKVGKTPEAFRKAPTIYFLTLRPE
jgi:hypothetical protein